MKLLAKYIIAILERTCDVVPLAGWVGIFNHPASIEGQNIVEI
jgi:hypothetical protein